MEKKIPNFTKVIKRDEDGIYLATTIPGIQNCHTQGKTVLKYWKDLKKRRKFL